MKPRVLCVDDDPSVLAAFQRNLRHHYDVEVASDATEALGKLRDHPGFAVIVADMRMPGMNGVNLLAQVSRTSPDTVRIMLTGNADQRTAADAVNQGHVFRFLTKPCAVPDLTAAIQLSVEQHRLITAERDLLENTLKGAIRTLTDILAVLDPDAFAQAESVRAYVHDYLAHFNVGNPWAMEMAALLANIGYVAIPRPVLLKARSGLKLTQKECDILDRVPQVGAELLSQIPRLEPVAEIIRYQRKHYDGTGLPAGNTLGDAIPIGARILVVLSDLHALVAAGASRSGAMEQLSSRQGWYDPRVLDSVAVCFNVAPPTTATPPHETLLLPLAGLQPGDRLVDGARTLQGEYLLPPGSCVSPAALQRLLTCSELQPVAEPLAVQRSKTP